MAKENRKKEYTQWEIRFLREQPFMPFGSLMNAFAQIHQGKGMSWKEFQRWAIGIFKLSRKFTRVALKDALEAKSGEEEEGIINLDFPIKVKEGKPAEKEAIEETPEPEEEEEEEITNFEEIGF